MIVADFFLSLDKSSEITDEHLCVFITSANKNHINCIRHSIEILDKIYDRINFRK